jgi:hypothetical protein
MRPEYNDGKSLPEIDDGLELRQEQAAKILKLFDENEALPGFQGRYAREVLGNDESIRGFVRDISPADYLALLVTINGILRNRERSEWGMDGKDVVIGSQEDAKWDFPEFEDKEYLLARSLTAAKAMVERNVALEDVALLLSSVISGVHPFNDGNGRTAKLLLAIINKGYSSDRKEILTEVLTSGDFSNAVNVSALQGYINVVIEKEMGMTIEGRRLRFVTEQNKGVVSFHSSVSAEKQTALKKIFRGSPRHAYQALFDYYKGSLDKYRDDVGDMKLDEMTSHLDDEAIDEVIKRWRYQKKNQVERIIDCIAHPDSPEYQVLTSDQTVIGTTESILDIYKAKIKRSTDEHLYAKVFG